MYIETKISGLFGVKAMRKMQKGITVYLKRELFIRRLHGKCTRFCWEIENFSWIEKSNFVELSK